MSIKKQLIFCLGLLSLFTLPKIYGQEGATCLIPGSQLQSKCSYIHRCDYFWSIIRQNGGKPPADVMANINAHLCASKNLVCCPDGAQAATKPTIPPTQAPAVLAATITAKISTDPALPPLADLSALKLHRNFKLINQPRCGVNLADRIVGGDIAKLKEFPYIALLKFGSRLDEGFTFNCGGSLISERYVLTAAHCVNRDLVGVRLGEHTISNSTDCDVDDCADPVQDIDIEKKIKHPRYDVGKKINDIALLRLRSPTDLTKNNVATVCLPTEPINQIDKLEDQAKNKMTISGFGKLGNGIRESSNVLMKAYVPYVPTLTCAQKFLDYSALKIYPTYLCGGGHNKTDTCHGDSGGPITTFSSLNGKPRTFLYGVISAGADCERSNIIYPGIYTNLAYYLDWILDNMEV